MKKKYYWVIILTCISAIFLLIPVMSVLNTKWNETTEPFKTPQGYSNDASQLSLTKIDTVIEVAKNKQALVDQLQELLLIAKKENLKIAIAGAQHSMGGHSIYPDGIVINMLSYKQMKLDTVTNILTVGSGALWEDAIAYLDTYGKSVSIMQAFSSFSIGGSLSVNGHGWQKNKPPLSASVDSFTLMNHEGEVLRCSRTENSELFRLVIGGYGLFGIILDVDLRVVDNMALRYKYVRVAPSNYVESYHKFIANNPNIYLVFGRLRISDKHFLEEAILNFFEDAREAPSPLLLMNQTKTESQRLVFRNSVNNEYGKRLRWNLEIGNNKLNKNALITRNQLLNDHVSLIENKDHNSTDLLQEYFIPERNFDAFIKDIQPILRGSKIDLLNITIRAVSKDTDSYMNYAREDVFGFVLLFNQKKTEKQELLMKQLTNKLVDAAIENDGTFYLPYRLHIDREKFRKVYPQADSFFEKKLKYDPQEIFNNKFYLHYN